MSRSVVRLLIVACSCFGGRGGRAGDGGCVCSAGADQQYGGKRGGRREVRTVHGVFSLARMGWSSPLRVGSPRSATVAETLISVYAGPASAIRLREMRDLRPGTPPHQIEKELGRRRQRQAGAADGDDRWRAQRLFGPDPRHPPGGQPEARPLDPPRGAQNPPPERA